MLLPLNPRSIFTVQVTYFRSERIKTSARLGSTDPRNDMKAIWKKHLNGKRLWNSCVILWL